MELLKSNRDIIIFGHADYLAQPKNKKENAIYHEIIKTIWKEFNAIVPTRNPANLIQSWMHYSKTRSQKLLLEISSHSPRFNEKDSHMIYKISQLKQNCVEVNWEKGEIHKLPGYPIINLRAEDEEDNLLTFANFLLRSKYSLPQLCSMQFQLMYPVWSKISSAILANKRYKIDIPKTNERRFIHYYDCEKISKTSQKLLSENIHPEFADKLLSTKKNKSDNKPPAKASSFHDFTKYVKHKIPQEWDIWEKSQPNSNHKQDM